MQTLKQQSVWLKFLLLLLAAQIVWTYLDPQLAVYLSTDGVFQHKWSAETAPILGPQLTAWLTSLFQPHVFRLVIAVGMLGAVGLLFPRNKSVFLGAVLVSLIIQALFLFRNPNFYVIHRPYIGMLIAFLPFLLWKSDTTFRLRPIDWLWCVTSVTYLASAISKLSHPDWLAGTALAELHGFPIRSELLIGLSTDVVLTKALTYSTIAAELLHGTTAFFRRFRFISWLAVFTMHLFALPTLQIYVATIPMLIFHLFLFDPNWLKARFFNGK